MRCVLTKCVMIAAGALLGSAGTALASGDPCVDAGPISAGRTSITIPCQGGTTIPDDCADTSYHNLFFAFTAPTAGKYQIDTFGTVNIDTVINVFGGCGNFDANRIACNDDSDGDPNNDVASEVVVDLAAGQTVKIAVGGYYNDSCGPAVVNISRFVGPVDCCDPWDNGRYDERGAQQSQVGAGLDWRLFGHVSFDDFYLCDAYTYHITQVRGTMCTNAIVPKAVVLLFRDCNGRPDISPRGVVAGAGNFGVDLPREIPLGLDCLVGSVQITETGRTNADGLRIVEVTANFDRLWLRGGEYWVSFIGYSGTANILDEFYWATAGNGTVKGRPGAFFNSDDGSFSDSDLLCCGCTDYAFCVNGTKCKVLLDNGVPDYIFRGVPGFSVAAGLGVPDQGPSVPPTGIALPSLQNGTRTADKVRAADDFVNPPCSNNSLCYIQAWVLSNCPRVRLDLFADGCHCPTEDAPIATLDATCVSEFGNFRGSDLKLLKAEFYGFKPIQLRPGHNYWVSAYGLGDNRQGARSYFLRNFDCTTDCLINFDSACVKGAPYDTSRWVKAQPPVDLAFLVAVQNDEVVLPPDSVQTPSTCRADVNHDNTVTVQDLFDFLAAWFSGCP